MVQFYDDFGSYPDGPTALNNGDDLGRFRHLYPDWSAPASVTVDDVGALSGRRLRATSAYGHFVALDPVTGAPHAVPSDATVEILTRQHFTSGTRGWGLLPYADPANEEVIIGGVDGTGDYLAFIVATSGGSFNVGWGIPLLATGWYWARMIHDRAAATLDVKVWADGDAEPASFLGPKSVAYFNVGPVAGFVGFHARNDAEESIDSIAFTTDGVMPTEPVTIPVRRLLGTDVIPDAAAASVGSRLTVQADGTLAWVNPTA